MNKKKLYEIGLLFFITIATFLFLFLISIAVKKNTNRHFIQILQSFVNERYTLSQKNYFVDSSQSSIYVFDAENIKTKKQVAISLVRITGICGPSAVIFVSDDDSSPEFLGKIDLQSTEKQKLSTNFFENSANTVCIDKNQITYWANKVKKTIAQKDL